MSLKPAAVAAIALVIASMASCTSRSSAGSSGSSDRVGPSTLSSAPASGVAYSACMRSHGVARYPDPSSDGHLPKGGAEAFGIGASAFQAAQRACQAVLPATDGSFIQQFQQCVTGGVCPQALVQKALTQQRAFAQCMRSHGVPNFPDPRIGPSGAPYFPASAVGLTRDDTHSSAFRAKEQTCQGVAGGTVPVLMG
jgi:hypothetical protein